MKKFLTFFLFNAIAISIFSINEGNEICINNGYCIIEGLEMDVSLTVPKTLTIIKPTPTGEADFDFGDVYKGADSSAKTTFKIKGDIENLAKIQTFQNNEPIDQITITNGNSQVKIDISSITMENYISNSTTRDELDVTMELKVSGSETLNLPSGEYHGIFTVRAILDGQRGVKK